jgi:hypothetical protein
MIYIGIDPGLEGAIAIWRPEISYEAVDMPLVAKSLYAPKIIALLSNNLDQKETICCLEKSQSMPGQGVASSHKIGVNYGVLLGILYTLGFAFLEVSPSVWKRALGLSSDKSLSIKKASELFPLWTATRKKDHNQAEALLLAWYLRSQTTPSPHY